MAAARELDIVVFGASGFVGKLTADYLAQSAPEGVRVGLGGRSKEKLERVRSELSGKASDWPLVMADSSDPASLREMAGRAKVVATTVGPYGRYGLPVVEACAQAGTHYADLTGESLFIRDAIDRYAAVAQDTGARIVHACGFDSIPSDIGVLLLHEAAKADGAGDLGDTTYVITGLRGGMSGGTTASAKDMFDAIAKDPSLRAVVDDPYVLSPERANEPDLGAQPDAGPPVFDADVGEWLAPFAMAVVNTRIVRRSNALQDWAYGRTFRYRETMATGGGTFGRVKAYGVGGGMKFAERALAFRPTRSLLDRILPDPGEGPSEKARANGYFKVDIHTRTATGRRYVCHIAAKGDPGYAATSVMFGESALCLALDEPKLPPRSGILTPATAMGTTLADRLCAAGHTYEVESR